MTQPINRDRVTAIELRDLDKLGDTLDVAIKHHRARDEMNAALHLAETVRYSPLTTELETVRELVTRYRYGAL